MKIKLNKNEYFYLCQNKFLSVRNHDLSNLKIDQENHFTFEISEDRADVIRDLCGERLQIVGFDEKYNLTKEGKILESLIDKFFIG